MYISCLMLFVCLLQLEKGRGCLVFMKHGKVLKLYPYWLRLVPMEILKSLKEIGER